MVRAVSVGCLLLLVVLGNLGVVAAQDSADRSDAEELAQVFSRGSPEEVRAAIAAGADIEGRYSRTYIARSCYGPARSYERMIESEHSYTPLMLASTSHGPDRIKALLELGADVHARTEGGLTALMIASCLGSPENVRVLLEAGADIEARSVNGWTALIFASGAYYFQNSEWRASERIPVLVEAGANLEARSLNGRTALYYAVGAKNLDAVTALLAAGADPNARSSGAWAPVILAGRDGSTEIIEALVAAGADVNARNSGGYTALMYAAGFATRDAVEALLRAGADTEARTEDGTTALLYLIGARGDEERLDVIRALVEGGADLAARYPPNGMTILHAYLQYGATPEEIEVLLDGGADPRAVTDDGISVFDLARRSEALRGTSVFWRLNDARFQ